MQRSLTRGLDAFSPLLHIYTRRRGAVASARLLAAAAAAQTHNGARGAAEVPGSHGNVAGGLQHGSTTIRLLKVNLSESDRAAIYPELSSRAFCFAWELQYMHSERPHAPAPLTFHRLLSFFALSNPVFLFAFCPLRYFIFSSSPLSFIFPSRSHFLSSLSSILTDALVVYSSWLSFASLHALPLSNFSHYYPLSKFYAFDIKPLLLLYPSDENSRTEACNDVEEKQEDASLSAKSVATVRATPRTPYQPPRRVSHNLPGSPDRLIARGHNNKVTDAYLRLDGCLGLLLFRKQSNDQQNILLYLVLLHLFLLFLSCVLAIF